MGKQVMKIPEKMMHYLYTHNHGLFFPTSV